MTLRESATPLAIGSFLLVAVTGALMFFHLDSGLNKLAHEWLGWALVAAVALHATVHFSAFRRYFTRPPALMLISVFVVLLAASFYSPAERGGKPPHIMAAETLLDAPLPRVAALLGKDTTQLVAELQAAGIHASTEQTLRQTGGDRKAQMRALGIILAGK